MRQSVPLKKLGKAALSCITAISLVISLSSCRTSSPPAAADTAAGNTASAAPVNPVAHPPPHRLTGAELYSIHCNRCHPERYPTERTAAQWKTIMLHMQVRANLPVEQSRLILKYLQDNSGR